MRKKHISQAHEICSGPERGPACVLEAAVGEEAGQEEEEGDGGVDQPDKAAGAGRPHAATEVVQRAQGLLEQCQPLALVGQLPASLQITGQSCISCRAQFLEQMRQVLSGSSCATKVQLWVQESAET